MALARLGINLNVTQAVGAAKRLSASLQGVRSSLGGLTLPFVGGVGLASLFGSSLIRTAVDAGRASSSYYRLTQSTYNLQVALGTVLLRTLDAVSPVLNFVIGLLTDDSGRPRFLAYVLVIGGALAALVVSAAAAANQVITLGSTLLRLAGSRAADAAAAGSQAAASSTAAAAQATETAATASNTAAKASNLAVIRARIAALITSAAATASTTAATIASTAAGAANVVSMGAQTAAANVLAVALRGLAIARALATGPVGIALLAGGLAATAGLALTAGGGGTTAVGLSPTSPLSAGSTSPYARRPEPIMIETRVELDGEVVGRSAQEFIDRNARQ